jgi:chaperonin cofactor prefoldin
MKPTNQSDIKKQQILFSLSLLCLVVTVALFTSAFFWSTNSEIEWTSDLRKENAQFETQIKLLKTHLSDIQEAFKSYEGVTPGDMNEQVMKNEVLNKIEALRVVVGSDPSSANNSAIKEISNSMHIMLTAYLNRQSTLSEFRKDSESCMSNLKETKDKLKDCEKDLDELKRSQQSNFYPAN